MAALTRALWMTSIGLAAAFALPAAGQTPCDNSASINCEFHPDYGWIIRGSAPRKDTPSDSATDKELREWREKNRDPDAARREAERRRDEREFERNIEAAEEIVRKAPWTGTCPPEWTDRTGGDPKVSYELTRRACYGGDMDRCRALQTVCKGDSMEPYKGTCRFGVATSQDTYDTVHNKLWNDQTIVEYLAANEKACVTERQAWACSTLARDYTFLRAPHAQPNKAYAYVERACQLDGAKSMDCVVLRDGCIPGGPQLAVPSPPPASPPPPQQSKGFIVPPLTVPLHEETARPPPPWGQALKEKPRPCPFPRVRPETRELLNAKPAKERLKKLRDAEEGCSASKAGHCFEAGQSHAVLSIREAKPEKSWDFLSRACKLDQEYCEWRSVACPGT